MADSQNGWSITRRRIVWGSLLVILLSIASFAVAVAWNRSRPEDISSGILIRPLQATDHVMGSRNAPIMLFVYTDSECPYCKEFDQVTLPKLQQQYGSSLAVVYRDFPLDWLHPLARHEMQAAECAGVQGSDLAYFDYLHAIFAETKSNETFPTTELSVIAQRLGLTMSTFEQCLSSGATAARVQADVVDGAGAGLTITPSIVIQVGGKRVLIAGNYYSGIRGGIQYLEYATASSTRR